MKIEAVELYQVSMQLQAPFETSFGVELERQCLVLRVEAEGLEGWGECVAGRFPGYSYETAQTAWSMLREFLIPGVLGTQLSDPGQLGALTQSVNGHPMAKAGLELALWDLFGKAQNAPLVEVLGGERGSVPVGVSVGIQPSEEQLLEVVESFVDHGYPRVKLKIKPGQDVKQVGAVRQRYPDLPLQVDANAAYPPGDTQALALLDAFGLLMVEQPYSKQDLLSHIYLAERSSTPICLDESIGSAQEAVQALELGACQIVNIKPGRVGGLAESIAIHDQCLSRGAPVWCGGMLETGIGRAANLALATLPGFTLPSDISASDRYYVEDLAWPRFELKADGTIDVPTGPGLGIEIDQPALERFTLRHERFQN